MSVNKAVRIVELTADLKSAQKNSAEALFFLTRIDASAT
jgi:hypothetical protein